MHPYIPHVNDYILLQLFSIYYAHAWYLLRYHDAVKGHPYSNDVYMLLLESHQSSQPDNELVV